MHKIRLAVLLILIVAFAGGCASQINVRPASFSHKDEVLREDDFIVLADRRVFAVMAFMNACGYDEGVGDKMHPVRLRVREILKEKAAEHPQQFQRWKKYYEKAALVNFFCLDYSVSLSADYPFERIRPDSELGYRFYGSRVSGVSSGPE